MRSTPDFDFGLTESAAMIREAAGRFADEQILPLAAEIDRNDRFPRELWEPMGALSVSPKSKSGVERIIHPLGKPADFAVPVHDR